ncbi:hypothetical protein TNCV_468791 [Trichonephila clavipes]|nr:hypothetical protein TNCV_468791 [Trichonephila clavipes]
MSNFMPSDNDVRTVLIFCHHLKKNAAESHQMLVEAYSGNSLSNAQCYRWWFEKLQNDDFDVRNEERDRPAMLNCKHYSMKIIAKRKNILQNN